MENENKTFDQICEERIQTILSMAEPQKQYSILTFSEKTLKELEIMLGGRARTVYQMSPDSREPGALKVSWKRLNIRGYEAELRINTEFGQSMGAKVYLYSLKRLEDNKLVYKVPCSKIIKMM